MTIISNKDWDKFYLEMARFIAEKRSKDNSTKCGCVIVKDKRILSTGYNGFPEGTEYDDPTKFERPRKYFFFEHSERNAIYNAARAGVSLANSTAYVTGPPCHDCARGLIQAGIIRIVIPVKHNFLDKATSERWMESCNAAEEMLLNADITIYKVDIDENSSQTSC